MKIVLLYSAETWETAQGTEPEVAGVFYQVPKENPVHLMAPYNLKRRVVEAGRAVTGRRGDKKTSVGLDWPHAEETRWTCG